MAPPKLPVVLLEDLPSTDDAFGGHQCIAEAIFELVTTEPGGRAIALVGPWGSGKSTVVKLLERIASENATSPLTSRPETEVFVFDAWAHEGDPLRRSFLERLITRLQRRRWVDEQDWDRRLDELSKRRRTSETVSSPVLTTPGIFLLLLLYLAPLSAALITASSDFWHKRTVLSGAVALYLLPMAFSVVYWWFSGRGDGLFGLFFNKNVEQTTTDTFESPDPTSVEFQQRFRDLARQSLDGEHGGQRRLVLVIDNLDRVEILDALKLWSSMSTFFEYPSGGSHAWTSRVWTVVPFDESAIKKLWQKDEKISLGEAFLAKTFQVRFGVPAPLLSDWAAFINGQLRIAFPKHDPQEFYPISRIFSILCADTNPPNPRDIKNFINQIGATYRSAPERIPLALHALYAALTYKGKQWKPGAALPSKERIEAYIGSDWRDSLSALYYNVPKSKALQAVFGPDVERYLLAGDADGISRLAENPGLEYVILTAIQRGAADWTNKEPFRIGLAAHACGAAAANGADVWGEAWAELKSAAEHTHGLSGLDRRSGSGFAALARGDSNGRLTKAILRSLSETEPQAPKPTAPAEWLSGAWEILSALISDGQEASIDKFFSLGSAPEFYLDFLTFPPTANPVPGIMRYLRPGCGSDATIEALNSAVSGNNFSKFEQAVQNMMIVPVQWQWIALVAAMTGRIQQVNANPEDVGTFVRTLLRLARRAADSHDALGRWVQSGWIFHYLAVSNGGNFPRVTASCLIAIMMYQPEANNQANPNAAMQGRNIYRQYMGNPHQSEPVFKELVAQATELVSAGALIRQTQSASLPKSALLELLKALASDPNASNFFDAKSVVDHSEFLRSVLGKESFEQLQAPLLESGDLGKELMGRQFSTELIPMYRLAFDTEGGKNVQSHVAHALKAIPTEGWLQHLAEGSEPVPILIELYDRDARVDLHLRLHDALAQIADRALAGTTPKVAPGSLEKLLSMLNDDQQENLKRHLVEEIAEASRSISVFLKYFGHAVEDCNLLKEFGDRIIREGFPKILQRSEPAELDWAVDTLKRCPGITENCARSSLNTLKDRVEERLSEKSSDETRTRLRAIADALGVKRKRSDPGA